MSPAFRKGAVALGTIILVIFIAHSCGAHSHAHRHATATVEDSTAADISDLTMNPKFQSRNVRPCPSIRSAPSNAQAAALVQCTQDATYPDHIVLTENVVVSIGRSHALLKADQHEAIDNSAPVYDITGSEIMYNCQAVDNVKNNSGKNCQVALLSGMSGICYRIRSGDWRCMLGGGQSGWVRPQDPPPTIY
jgi:hypothetical protein